jgi:uncharacterized protein YcaQ
MKILREYAQDDTMSGTQDLRRLRAHAVSQTLFPPTTLQAAINRLGFVQADPIRSPARAQDLILRHRVKGYRAGDLEQKYPSLDLEEDYLYAYGFMPRDVWRLIHPRATRRLSVFERKVLRLLRDSGQKHPRELHSHFGGDRVINAWGGFSKATKQALERLHHRGLLRVCRRDNGVRVYEPAPAHEVTLSASQRVRRLVMIVVGIFSPVTESSLRLILRPIMRHFKSEGGVQKILRDLLRSGELEKQLIDGRTYLWPAGADRTIKAPAEIVRFLAPFDPVVWDRRRFEHLWGWAYRFEAYTPPAKRVRGYYALPLLWRDDVIGWANVSRKNDELTTDIGFVGARPRERQFEQELEAEIERMRTFQCGWKMDGKLELRSDLAARVSSQP